MLTCFVTFIWALCFGCLKKSSITGTLVYCVHHDHCLLFNGNTIYPCLGIILYFKSCEPLTEKMLLHVTVKGFILN